MLTKLSKFLRFNEFGKLTIRLTLFDLAKFAASGTQKSEIINSGSSFFSSKYSLKAEKISGAT